MRFSSTSSLKAFAQGRGLLVVASEIFVVLSELWQTRQCAEDAHNLSIEHDFRGDGIVRADTLRNHQDCQTAAEQKQQRRQPATAALDSFAKEKG
jgi:hypothetical protein